MSLTTALLEHVDPLERPSAAELEAIEVALAGLLQAGQRAWPELKVDDMALLAYVAERLPSTRPISAAIASMRSDELYLAFACHRGDPRAMAALETHYGGHIEAVIGGLDGQGLTRDDFRQIVRHRLFVSDEHGPARITGYAGHGSLAAWLRVTARRAGLNAIRGKHVEAELAVDDDLLSLPQSLGDPELDYFKETYRESFRESFLEAVASLPPRERTLLRQTIVHKLTVRQIGRMYSIHHATAARWIAQARQLLVDGTRAALMRRLDISQRELDSIMVLIASQLDVSVVRVLGPDES